MAFQMVPAEFNPAYRVIYGTYRRCEKRWETCMPALLTDAQTHNNRCSTGAQCQITVWQKLHRWTECRPCVSVLRVTHQRFCVHVCVCLCAADDALMMSPISIWPRHRTEIIICVCLCCEGLWVYLRKPMGTMWFESQKKQNKKKRLRVCLYFNVQYLIFALQACFPNARACKCMSCCHTVYNK